MKFQRLVLILWASCLVALGFVSCLVEFEIENQRANEEGRSNTGR